MESEEYQNDRSMSKIETLSLLNDTIDRLQTIAREIETKSSEELPNLASVKTLAQTIENFEVAVKNPQNPELANRVAPPPQSRVSKQKPLPSRKHARNNRRNIAILSGVVIIIVAGFWFWLSPEPLGFLTRQSPQPEIIEEVKDLPEATVPAPEIAENPVVPTPEPPPATEPIEEREPEIPNTTIPLELTAPGDSEELLLKTVEPQLQLTPEQSLVAAVRERVTEITQDYSENLILSVRADFIDSKLLINVGNDWYELSDSRQSKLADEILERSRKLDFQKLELKDADDNLIARSPVVGDRAIIYRQQQAIDSED
ncbi:hypothetical protein [Myxosarcina sp. GI1]|uniref:hypothetical protein n=1 Tax=Myxosarcina sp. GI1 TaxID=1541065 RepID=UPI00068EFC77|nr:hypothetical protein [Myxosarcina sp. GI1]